MRIALIRGSAQRNYELPNFEFGNGHAVDLFISRRLELGAHSPYFTHRRLPAVSDLALRLGPRPRGVIDLTMGPTEYLFGLEKALRGYDIAHAFEVLMPVTVQAVKARKYGGVKRVVATVSENIPFKPDPNPLVTRRIARAAAEVDHFIAITERSKLHLTVEGIPPDRISVQPFGTDVERFRPAQQRRAGPLRILTSARLEPAKGVEDLTIAVGLLTDEGHDLELIFVGSGPLRARIEHIAKRMGIANKVRFHSVPWVDMPDLYREGDIFVLASAPARTAREQFGFAVIEAMATGLPALVGATGALREVAGRDDVLVQPHDPLDLTNKLRQLVLDEGRRRELGDFNRRFALEHYDQRKVAQRYMAIYERVLARPPRD